MRIAPRGGPSRRAPIVLFAALLPAAGCTGPGLALRYRGLEAELSRAAPEGSAPGDSAETAADDPFAGAAVLEREALVAAVLRRNPSLRAARFAWRAALARVPQQTALEDPRIGVAVAPGSIGSRRVDDSYRFDVSQPISYPGTLALRGEAALGEAEAASHDFAALRLRLATLASLLFYDHYLAARALEVNHHHAGLLGELRAVARSRYEAGEVSAQAPLQAELEIARMLRERALLEARQQELAAQLNALLHRPADAALPPPPAALPESVDAPRDRGHELARALAERSELRAADARVRAGEAEVGLARREFLPDLTLSGGYDSFWEESAQRPFVALSVGVPLQLGRRRAAVAEAEARLASARSARESVEDEVRLAVESAGDRLDAAAGVLTLYRDRLLPAARDQVEAARAAFESGQESFLALIDAERALREMELGHEEAIADRDRRAAELQSATGVLPGLP